MFVTRAEWRPFELRQGDVLVGIPFPFASQSTTTLLGKIPPGEHNRFPIIAAALQAHRDPDDISYFTGQVTMKLCACVVVTQCCELRTNPRNQIREVSAITVCRIIEVRQSMLEDADKLRSLQENRDPRVPGVRCYKNYFWVDTANGLSEDQLMMDFSQMACIPTSEFPSIMDNKHAQMDDRTRMKLKIKLGIFFAKPTDEEVEAHISQDPWGAIPEMAPAAPGPVAPAELPPADENPAVGQ